LIDAAIFREIELLVQEFTQAMPSTPTLKEAILLGSSKAIELVHSHPVLIDLFNNSTVYHLPAVILDADKPGRDAVMKWWGPVFKRARQNAELDVNISDDDLIEWIMSIHYMFILRTELTPARREHLLKTFFLPSLTPTAKTD